VFFPSLYKNTPTGNEMGGLIEIRRVLITKSDAPKRRGRLIKKI